MDAKQNGRQAAHARPYSLDTYFDFPHEVEAQSGLTKREAFAMAALTGCLANSDGFAQAQIPAICIRQADALLAELAKEAA